MFNRVMTSVRMSPKEKKIFLQFGDFNLPLLNEDFSYDLAQWQRREKPRYNTDNRSLVW